MSVQYSLENYTFLKTIGEGTFGKVKLALHKLTQEKVAIKILEKKKINSKKDLERIEKEIKYMKILNHPNIVKIYEIIEDENNFYIVMEYVPGGELFNYIVKNKRLTENEASFFYSQIIHIIQEIHKHKICHRDLKPENLLLTQNKTIKIIDFGLSNEYIDYLMTPCGSPCYASPEVIKGMKYSGLGIDLWASGIILFSMLCGYLPFDDKNNDVLFKKILKCKIEFPKNNNVIISENAKDLILKILQLELAKRITLDEILVHPFLVYGNKKYKEKIKMDINKQDKLIIDYMTNVLRIAKEEKIRRYINNNRHNNLTTIFYLLKKKYNEGRFDYNIINSTSKMQTINKLNRTKLNRVINTEINLGESDILLNNLDKNINNIIKKKVIKNNNIIIINNNNVLNQQHQQKMDYLFNPLIVENSKLKQNYEKIIKKIDTSVSLEKNRKKNISSQNIEIVDNNINKKIKEKKIFYKKYINTITNINSIDKDESIEKKNNIYEHKKKIVSSLHLKSLTNLQNYSLGKSKNIERKNNLDIKNRSLIDSFTNEEENDVYNNRFYRRIRINNNLNSSIIQKSSPDEKLLSQNANYYKYINNTMKYEKVSTMENKGNRKSVNDRENKKYIIELINPNPNESMNSIDNKHKQKEHFYKKINLNKLKDSNKKIKVNKLALNDNSIGNNFGNNNIFSYRDKFSRETSVYSNKINKTINNDTIGRKDNRRLRIKVKGIMNRSTLNDSITYTKKILGINKAYTKTNNYLILSTNLNLFRITKRINKFCIEKNIIFRQNEDKYIVNINPDDEFVLDIKNSEGSYVIKFTHEKGDESQTKIYMNNLFAEIAK